MAATNAGTRLRANGNQAVSLVTRTGCGWSVTETVSGGAAMLGSPGRTVGATYAASSMVDFLSGAPGQEFCGHNTYLRPPSRDTPDFPPLQATARRRVSAGARLRSRLGGRGRAAPLRNDQALLLVRSGDASSPERGLYSPRQQEVGDQHGGKNKSTGHLEPNFRNGCP